MMNSVKIVPSHIRYFNIPYDVDYDYQTAYNAGRASVKTKVENNFLACYECPHLKEKRVVRLIEDGTCPKNSVPDPRIKTSNFEGCPHWYGKIFTPEGKVYEIQEKITERLLKVGKETGGDWVGYKVGEFTNRFLSREMLIEAYEFLKELL